MDTITRLVYTQERNSLSEPVQHPKFRLAIFTARSFYTAGGSFTGNLKIQCKSDNIKFKNLKVELIGLEEISRASLLQRELKRHTFVKYHHLIPESQHLLSKVIEPDRDGFFEADRGEYLAPFEMQLSLKLPTSTEPDRIKRHVTIRYLAIGSIELKLSNGQLITVTQSLPVIIYEKVQLKPELRVKLAETPQSTEIFHTFPGSSTTIFFRISIDKMIWVSGSLLTAQVTLRKALKRKVSKIQLELIEDVKTFRNPNLVVEEDETLEEETYTEESSTLVDTNPNRGSSLLLSSYSSLDSISCVVGKRSLGGNSTPAQVDLETEERRWNLQVMVPSDSHTVQKTRFSSITYRVRASISFFMTKQIFVELPVLIVHPLTLDTDPYQNIRDGILLTTPYAYDNIHKLRVYEQSMDGIGLHLTSTSLTEHLAISQMKDMHLPKVIKGDGLSSSSTVSHSSSDCSYDERPAPAEIVSHTQDLTPLDCDAISCHSSTYTVSTAPNSPSKSLGSSAAKFHSHRRARSEACKNDFFFQTMASGELPRINLNWDWADKTPILFHPSPPAKAHSAAPLERSEAMNFGGKVQPQLDEFSLNKQNNEELRYLDKCPWRNQPDKDGRRALSLYSLATQVGCFSKLPTPQTQIPVPLTPTSDSTLVSRDSSLPFSQHNRARHHPEALSRKYSFPPKQALKSVNATAQPPTTRPLKSAFSKHTRSQTCGDTGKVRFATDSDLKYIPSWRHSSQAAEPASLSCKLSSHTQPSCNSTSASSPPKHLPPPGSKRSSLPAFVPDARTLMADLSKIDQLGSGLIDDTGKSNPPLGPIQGDTLFQPSALQPTIDQGVSAAICPKVIMVLSSRPRTRWRESFQWRSKAALSTKKRLSMPCQAPIQFHQTAGWEDVMRKDNPSPFSAISDDYGPIPISKPHLKQE